MQEQNRVNFDVMIEQGRKLQSQAVFQTFRQGFMLLKICLGKKTGSSSPRNGARVAGRTNTVLEATIAK